MKEKMEESEVLIPSITTLPWKNIDTGEDIELLEKILDEIPYY